MKNTNANLYFIVSLFSYHFFFSIILDVHGPQALAPGQNRIQTQWKSRLAGAKSADQGLYR